MSFPDDLTKSSNYWTIRFGLRWALSRVLNPVFVPTPEDVEYMAIEYRPDGEIEEIHFRALRP